MPQHQIRFWLPGEPVTQARARTGKGHGYYPAKSAGYRKWAALSLRSQYAGKPPLSGPVKLGLLFYRVRPKSNRSDWPTIKPDLDNYVKMLCDALKDAGVLADDAQVCRLDAGKFWIAEEPCVEVVLESLA